VSDPVVVGRYALYDELASGGMGSVHLGVLRGPVGFSRAVAIKRMHPRLLSDRGFVSSFVDEARLAARIRHPNVVPTLDVLLTAGELYHVMEYVHGETASRLSKAAVAAGARVPIGVGVGLMNDVLLGLHAAHDARNARGEPLQIVHRDVSPQNVLVGVDGHARVLDFGVAKAVGRLRETQSGLSEVRGKLGYLAPEQLRDGTADLRTDVFAASVMLWELLAGRRFQSSNDMLAILERLEGAIEPPSMHAPSVPREVDEVVLRGLARLPNDRWPTARAMALALERCTPRATASEIAMFVQRTARDALAERQAMLDRVEGEMSEARLSQVFDEISASGDREDDVPTREHPRAK